MTVMPQQVVNPVTVDPNNVAEAYANGPVNVNVMGPCATLTFTNIRGDVVEVEVPEIGVLRNKVADEA